MRAWRCSSSERGLLASDVVGLVERFSSAGLRRRTRDSVRWGASGLAGVACFGGIYGTLDRAVSIAVRGVGLDEDAGVSSWVYKSLCSSGGDVVFLFTLTTTRGFLE